MDIKVDLDSGPLQAEADSDPLQAGADSDSLQAEADPDPLQAGAISDHLHEDTLEKKAQIEKVEVVPLTDVIISTAENSDALLQISSKEKYFQEVNRELWEYRERSQYTDLLLVCQGGSMRAHSAMLARLFKISEIQLNTEEETQLIFLPHLTIEEVEAALLETYASGSIASFCNLLAIDVFKKKPKERKTVTRKRCTETDHSTPPLETKIMQEDAASDITMDLGLVDVDVEPEDILAQPSRRRTRNRNKYEKMKKDKDKDPLEDASSTTKAERKPFKCADCKYSAVSSTKLEVHRNAKHLGLNKYSCGMCDFQANKQLEMKIHIKQAHDRGTEPNRRTYKCAHCTKFVATSKKMLDQHIIDDHKNVRKYHCDQCSFSSNYINNFERHQKVHLGITGNYLCPHCPKAFFVEAKLRSHMLVHSNDKNFVCDECAAKFKRKDDLKVHMRTHLPDEIRAADKAKRLTKVCETCGKKFEKNWKLKRHMVVHNKDVPVAQLEKPAAAAMVAAPRCQAGTTLQPIQEFIVLTSDGKILETSTEKFIMDRIVVEPKYIDGHDKFLDAKSLTDKIVFSQIQYTEPQ